MYTQCIPLHMVDESAVTISAIYTHRSLSVLSKAVTLNSRVTCLRSYACAYVRIRTHTLSAYAEIEIRSLPCGTVRGCEVKPKGRY